MSKKSKLPIAPRRNPVAKHAYKVNRAILLRDHTQYTRKKKHKGLEPFPISGTLMVRLLEKAWVA